jgi:hypothetical protein
MDSIKQPTPSLLKSVRNGEHPEFNYSVDSDIAPVIETIPQLNSTWTPYHTVVTEEEAAFNAALYPAANGGVVKIIGTSEAWKDCLLMATFEGVGFPQYLGKE